MLHCDLRIDPLTRLPNLCGLLEIEHQGAMGRCGQVLAAMICPAVKGDRCLPENADACVEGLALLLRTMANDERVCAIAAPYAPSAFRIGNEQFVLVLPNCNQGLITQLADNLRMRYHDHLPQSDALFTEVSTASCEYQQKGGSKFCILKATYRALALCGSNTVNPTELPAWAELLIDQMAVRTCSILALIRTTRTLALTDEISGLCNHRAAQLYLEEMMQEYKANGTPCSVLLADGDNLRHYNEWGYQHGNRMIRDLAEILIRATRSTDYVTRWLSGDEFLIILPGADYTVAKRIAERLRHTVQTETSNWALPITVSIGVASCPDDGKTAAELIACVQERNLIAKKTGKNQVV
ncbi:MAG TPA: diguanylate cyclase [Firmicutes bacterium]|jgi:diguanylate cyclase (GGDEF)-like protein|nr:diguanylate cyclase [Bacillota bacterium]